VNGTSISLGGSGTVTANTPNSLTFNNGGAGGASGSTFNGSGALTVSYNTVGAPSTTGTNASGTWSINVTGSAGSATTATSATTAGTVTTAAQPNITSVGTLSSLAVTGNITAGNVSATLFTGTATQARYADLAEMYCADADYEPGTVLIFGGKHEVTVSNLAMDQKVAGVVSTNPAHLMNSTLECEHPVAVALTGRVPTLVVGPITKGDMMVSAGNGRAKACAVPVLGSVIGKAIEDFDGEQGMVEIVVGRL
jgi:hypothetical protein